MGIICISLATFKPFLWTYCPWLIGAASRNRTYPTGNTNSESSKKWSRKATSGVNGSHGDRSHKSISMGPWSKKKEDLESFDYGKLHDRGQTSLNGPKPNRDVFGPGSELSPRGSTDHIIPFNGNAIDNTTGIMKTTQVLVRDEETNGRTKEKIAGHYPS